MTASQQTTLAAMVTNSKIAAAYINRKDAVEPMIDEGSFLLSLITTSKLQILYLADLLSKRRFNRAANLLPASRALLGSRFETAWLEYLDTAAPGVPTATLEAWQFAKFLGESGNENAAPYDVLRYERCLNELAYRLKFRAEAPSGGVRKLAIGDHVRLSDFAIVECFNHDVAASVGAVKGNGSTAADLDNNDKSCAVLFKPKSISGIAIDVVRLPNILGNMLARLGQGMPLGAWLAGFPADTQKDIVPFLAKLWRTAVLVSAVPANNE